MTKSQMALTLSHLSEGRDIKSPARSGSTSPSRFWSIPCKLASTYAPLFGQPQIMNSKKIGDEDDFISPTV